VKTSEWLARTFSIAEFVSPSTTLRTLWRGKIISNIRTLPYNRWMEKRPPHIRFHLRKYGDEVYWSIIDVFTGQPHVVNKVVLDSFGPEEADDMVDLLNLQDMKVRGILKFP
jgi:hypothetical protein